MEASLKKYDKEDMIQLMRNMDLPCRGTIVSKQSKYHGQTFDVSWAGYWGIALKVKPINRTYNYVCDSVEITKDSIDNFKKLMVDHVDGAVDFFKRPLKAEDVIFYKGELHRISFFVTTKKENTFTKNVAIEALRPKEDWEDFEDCAEFIGIHRLDECILIDDPLLLLKL